MILWSHQEAMCSNFRFLWETRLRIEAKFQNWSHIRSLCRLGRTSGRPNQHRLRFHYPSVKTLCDDGIRCPFPMLSFHYIFQASVDDKQSIEEDEERTLRCNFIFFMSLSFFYATNYLLDMNQIWDTLLVSFWKNKEVGKDEGSTYLCCHVCRILILA